MNIHTICIHNAKTHIDRAREFRLIFISNEFRYKTKKNSIEFNIINRRSTNTNG